MSRRSHTLREFQSVRLLDVVCLMDDLLGVVDLTNYPMIKRVVDLPDPQKNR